MKTAIAALLFAISCFGQAPTVIQPSDKVSDSRQTINDNFSLIYNGKGGNVDCSGTPGSVVVKIGVTSICSSMFLNATGAGLIGFQPTGGTVPTTVAGALNSSFLYDIGYSNLLAACSAAVSAGKTMVLTQTWDLNGACAASIHAYKGGIIKPASGHAATLTGGSFDGDSTKHFDTSLGGTITGPFTTRDGSMQAAWWGILPSATLGAATDVSVNLRAMLAAMDATNQTAGNSTGQRIVKIATGGFYGITTEIDLPENIVIDCGGTGYGGANNTPKMGGAFVPLANSITLFKFLNGNRFNYINGCNFQANAHTGISYIYMDTCAQCGAKGNYFQGTPAIAVKGGGVLYLDMQNNVYSHSSGMANDFQNSYSSATPGYGIATGTFKDEVVSAAGGIRVGGYGITMIHEDIEAAINAGSSGMTGTAGAGIQFCDSGIQSMGSVNLIEPYMEVSTGTAVSLTGISQCGGQIRTSGGWLVHAGGGGTAIAAQGSDGSTQTYFASEAIIGTRLQNWAYGICDHANGNGFSTTATPGHIVDGINWTTITTAPFCETTDLNNQALHVTNTVTNHYSTSITDPLHGQIFSQGIVPAIARIASPSTTIDLSLGNIFGIEDSMTLTGVVGRVTAGNYFGIYSDNSTVVVPNSVFKMKVGRDVTLTRPDQILWFQANYNGTIQEITTVSEDIPVTVGALGTGQPSGTHSYVTDGDGTTATCTGGGSTFGYAMRTAASTWKCIYP